MKCSFCGYDVNPGTGKKFINKDGKAMLFCSSKCEKNSLKLKRIPRNLKWTKYYKKGE